MALEISAQAFLAANVVTRPRLLEASRSNLQLKIPQAIKPQVEGEQAKQKAAAGKTKVAPRATEAQPQKKYKVVAPKIISSKGIWRTTLGYHLLPVTALQLQLERKLPRELSSPLSFACRHAAS